MTDFKTISQSNKSMDTRAHLTTPTNNPIVTATVHNPPTLPPSTSCMVSWTRVVLQVRGLSHKRSYSEEDIEMGGDRGSVLIEGLKVAFLPCSECLRAGRLLLPACQGPIPLPCWRRPIKEMSKHAERWSTPTSIKPIKQDDPKSHGRYFVL